MAIDSMLAINMINPHQSHQHYCSIGQYYNAKVGLCKLTHASGVQTYKLHVIRDNQHMKLQ